MSVAKEITEEQHKELLFLLKRRKELVAAHANSPLDCYSLAQKILIQRGRKEDYDFLTKQINAIMT